MLTLRPAHPADAYEIVRINTDGWRRAYVGIVPDDVLAAIDVGARTNRYQRRMVEERTHDTMVAVDDQYGDGRIVGYVHFGPYRDGESLDPTVGEVVAIYVDPPAWGTGAGRLLLSAAVDSLADRGCAEVRLWVLEANHPARGFYAHLGFRLDHGRSIFPVRRVDGTLVELPEVRYVRRVGGTSGDGD